jgi:CTP synthase (UTP-ammonia lyase)
LHANGFFVNPVGVHVVSHSRCRYEVNPEMVSKLEEEGLLFVGRDETGERMEVVELQDNPSGHPFYVAAQVRGRGGWEPEAWRAG